ncbi:MAG: carbamoyltransferase HypF [Clostridiales bacterium]|nr:carbamoyltransferase HypF [Clostridiales bacterium]
MNPISISQSETICTRRIRVYGIVQGVGFRPTVSRHAAAAGICGSVCNKGPYVEIIAQGTEAQVEEFLTRLKTNPPKRAAILKLDIKPAGNVPEYHDFTIMESAKTSGEIFISPDIAICEACSQELFTPADRRYQHPFINCTCCGPRLTILDALPYDRERTSMKEFPMCPACEEEYHSPDNRRYDAQPVCCNDCGPEVYLLGRKERGKDAIRYVRQIIKDGGIVAIKGIGGFHLCCDATNEDAVMRLRERKCRPAKPFAIMARNLEAAARECEIPSDAVAAMLDGHQKPIILLKKRPGGQICQAVAPDNPKLGVMLPYAPIHLLLFCYDGDCSMPDCLVMTSGNNSGAPICRDDREAKQELSRLCDCILSHNRQIRIRADDSVTDFFEGTPYMIRRSRGFAPLPVLLGAPFCGCVAAVGGELKNTFCIASGNLFYPSPYIGDLEDLRTVDALKETVARFHTLLETQPQLIACDLHPRYHSMEVAHSFGLPVLPIQHHYAHIVSCMAENDVSDPVIGVSFDGTGYGSDQTVWGGEFLLADYHGFTREGSIEPFWQVGGDRSAKEGWRIAVSMIGSLEKDRQAALDTATRLGLCSGQEARILMRMMDQHMNAIRSTSAGRLFDAVSAILGIRRVSTFEGEASTALQFAAERFLEKMKEHPVRFRENPSRHTDEIGELLLSDQTDNRLLLATGALVRTMYERRLAGESPEQLACFFHETLAAQIAAACRKIREKTGVTRVALSGGVFQNLLLVHLTKERLTEDGFDVLLHSLIPPNDGGIALGQAVVAMQYLKGKANHNDTISTNEPEGACSPAANGEPDRDIFCHNSMNTGLTNTFAHSLNNKYQS